MYLGRVLDVLEAGRGGALMRKHLGPLGAFWRALRPLRGSKAFLEVF